jgi:phage tail-like protein
MARPTATDFFHNMRFGVDLANSSFLAGGWPAGFSACTTPEASNEAVEYREGQQVYTQKFPGLPTMNDLTLSKGVVLSRNQFYDWMFSTIEGGVGYRADVIITHYHRSALPGFGGFGTANTTSIPDGSVANRKYSCYEAFPIRCKVAGDLDATSSDVSVSELDISYEYFSIADDAGVISVAIPIAIP